MFRNISSRFLELTTNGIARGHLGMSEQKKLMVFGSIVSVVVSCFKRVHFKLIQNIAYVDRPSFDNANCNK